MRIFLSNTDRIAGTIKAQAIEAANRETSKNIRKMTTTWTEVLVAPALCPRKKKGAQNLIAGPP